MFISHFAQLSVDEELDLPVIYKYEIQIHPLVVTLVRLSIRTIPLCICSALKALIPWVVHHRPLLFLITEEHCFKWPEAKSCGEN